MFSEENRKNIINAVSMMRGWKQAWKREMSETEKEELRTLLQRMNVINRIMSSDSHIKVFDYRKYCLDTYIFILETWPWVQVSEAIHRLLGHSFEFIVLNQNCGLKTVGEQGSEATHRVERAIRDHGSRKVTLVKGDEDTFRHSAAASDPGLRSLDRRPWCSFCKEEGHTTRRCKKRFLGPHGSEDDQLVEIFILEKNQPEPEDQVALYESL